MPRDRKFDTVIMIGESLLIGLGLFLGCGALGLFLVYYLAKQKDRREEKIQTALDNSQGRWDSEMLDPKFESRAFLKKSFRFGDLPFHLLPEGIMVNDGGTYFWLEHRKGAAAAKVANKRYSLDFIAMERNYTWIQGGSGKFQLSGGLVKGDEFKALASDYGIDIFFGIPEGAEVPRRYKG